MKKDIIYLFIICLSIACSALKPERKYNTDLWEIDWEQSCLHRLDQNDDVITKCRGDVDFPEDLVGIELWQWVRERQFADKAISQCKEWR